MSAADAAGASLAGHAARLAARADQVAHLAKHASAPGVRCLGLYGLQEIRDGQVWVDPRREAARPAVMAESGARSVVVAGDDLGDLAAFAAVAQLAAEGGDGLRVAVRSAEAPAPLLTAADLVVDGSPEMRDFLDRPARTAGAQPDGQRPL